MKKKIFFLLLFNVYCSLAQTHIRHDICDKIIIGDFKCSNCTTLLDDLPKNMRNAVSQAFKYPYCEVLHRDRLADILNRKDKEKLISAINDLSIEEKQTLKSITKAQRVLFGEMEFQRADNSLLVTLVINNLETGVQEAMTLIEIPNGEYETHSKREPYVTKGIEETLLGKKSSNAKPSNDQAKVEYLDDRQKFFGKYKITATCTNGGNSRGVVVTVTASSMPNEVLLSYSSSSSLIKATISGDIIIVNAAQTYTFSSTVYSFTGSGRMSGSAIVALNTIYIGQSSTLNCDETWMKQ